MKTLIVPDVHGNLDLLLKFLEATGATRDGKREPGWTIGSVGDLVNMGSYGVPYRGFLSDDLGCLELAETLPFDWICIGNHELWYTHGLQAGVWNGMARMDQLHPDVMRVMGRLVRTGVYRVAEAVGEVLVSHAGVTGTVWEGQYWSGLQGNKAEPLANWLNEKFVEMVTRQTDIEEFPVFNWVGRSAGGTDPSGSIFWARPQDFGQAPEMELKQLVGHTPSKKNPEMMNENVLCIDSGGYSHDQPFLTGMVYDSEWDVWWAVWYDSLRPHFLKY